MFASTPSTNAPVRYRTQQTYAPTFTGPITRNQEFERQAATDSMAQAAMGGDIRQYNQQAGKGVGAGSQQSAYRAGLLADSNAAKAYAQARQDRFNRVADVASANLLFQERQAGEQGWLRDLLLDRDDIRIQDAKAAYKRKADVDKGTFQRAVEDAVAAKNREVEIASSII